MTGKELLEFQAEPVSRGTPESGQAIGKEFQNFSWKESAFIPTRDVQLGLGLI